MSSLNWKGMKMFNVGDKVQAENYKYVGVIEEIDDGTAYITLNNGVEMDFPVSELTEYLSRETREYRKNFKRRDPWCHVDLSKIDWSPLSKATWERSVDHHADIKNIVSEIDAVSYHNLDARWAIYELMREYLKDDTIKMPECKWSELSDLDQINYLLFVDKISENVRYTQNINKLCAYSMLGEIFRDNLAKNITAE